MRARGVEGGTGKEILAAAEAALFGGTLIASGEVVFLTLRHGRPYLAALPYAVLAYGGMGAFLGCLLGLLTRAAARWTRSRPQQPAVAWAVVGAVGSSVVAGTHLTNWLRRSEGSSRWPPALAYAAVLLLGLILGGILHATWRRWLGRPRWLGRAGRGSLAALSLLLLSFPLQLWGQSAGPDASPGPLSERLIDRPNIVLIVADALRVDTLSCYQGSARTPNLDQLAREGVRYEQHMVQSSWTKPSFGTIFSSLYPSSHTAVDELHPLPAAVTTLAEQLLQEGYWTGGLANNPYLAPSQQFDQGFVDYAYREPDFYAGANRYAARLGVYPLLRWFHRALLGDRLEVRYFYQEAGLVTQAAVSWLEEHRGERFFLFLHYMDPHEPYFEHPYDGRAHRGWESLDPSYGATVRRVYDGEVEHMDAAIGDLLAWLRQEGLYEDALIVFTSDHGEEFLEHGGWDHGATLYEEQIHVPLLIKYPDGERAGSVVPALSRSLDIAPTILDVAACTIPQTMQGQSLYSGSTPPAYAFAETLGEGRNNPLWAVRGERYKWVRALPGNSRGLPEGALYDLWADPLEQVNLAGQAEDLSDRWDDLLQQFLFEAQGARVVPGEQRLEEQMELLLRRLGY